MAYADQQMSGNKIAAIIIVALLHIAAIYALVTGLLICLASFKHELVHQSQEHERLH